MHGYVALPFGDDNCKHPHAVPVANKLVEQRGPLGQDLRPINRNGSNNTKHDADHHHL